MDPIRSFQTVSRKGLLGSLYSRSRIDYYLRGRVSLLRASTLHGTELHVAVMDSYVLRWMMEGSIAVCKGIEPSLYRGSGGSLSYATTQPIHERGRWKEEWSTAPTTAIEGV